MNFHTVFLLIGVLTLAATLVSLRREHIRTEYSVSWLLVGAILTVLGGTPGLLDLVSRSIGLSAGTCFLMAAGVLISALVFEISHVVSRLRDENTMLTQRIAILEFQLQSFVHRHGQQKDT